jgi:hypothetical protein
MIKGPKGERRLADVTSNAVLVMQIATGEVDESPVSGKARSGHAGAAARVRNTTPEQRSETARKAAAARWA